MSAEEFKFDESGLKLLARTIVQKLQTLTDTGSRTIEPAKVEITVPLAANALLTIPLNIEFTEAGLEPLQADRNVLKRKIKTTTAPKNVVLTELSKQIDRLVAYNTRSSQRWDVSINISSTQKSIDPKYKKDTLFCFLMGLTIPKSLIKPSAADGSRKRAGDTLTRTRGGNVVPEETDTMISWLYQVMIDPATHKKVEPSSCFKGDYQTAWGTLFMQLFERITSEIRMTWPAVPMVAGLVDDSFVTKCGQAVVFSDYRRLTGKLPWYEGYGYKMANIEEYADALLASTYGKASLSVDAHFQDYRTKLEACFKETVKSTATLADCISCAELQSLCGTCTNEKFAKLIIEQIERDTNEHKDRCPSLQWISDDAVETCFTAFNRHYNSQTIHWPETRVNNPFVVFDDLVIRLKFF